MSLSQTVPMSTPALGRRFEEALLYAVHAHGGQVRKGTETPYIGHLLGVCALTLELGGGEDEAVAALLHDAAEDAGGRARLEDIRARFGEDVATTVEQCTDSFETPKPPWRERKAAYVAHLEEASPAALRVGLADKIYNARSVLRDYRQVGEALWSRFNAGRDDVLWYYRALADAYLRLVPGPYADELARVVQALEDEVAA